MIGDRMLPARVPMGLGVPEIQYMQHTSASTFLTGEPLIFNAGEVELGGTNPTGIVGISLAPAGRAPGYQAANDPQVNTGRQRKLAVARANRVTVFLAGFVNGSSTRITPLLSYVGNTYGITKHGNSWFIDIAKIAGSGNDRVEIVGIDDLYGTNGIGYFKWMEAHLATP